MKKDENVVEGVVVVVVVVDVVVVVIGLVLSSVVVFGASVVKRVDRVLAVAVVKLGRGAEVEVVVEVGGFQSAVVVVVVGVVTALAIALAVVLITLPNEAAVVLMTDDVTVDDLVAVNGASRKSSTSRGAVPSIVPAFRIECCLILSGHIYLGMRQGCNVFLRKSFRGVYQECQPRIDPFSDDAS